MKKLEKNQLSIIYGGVSPEHTSGTSTVQTDIGPVSCNYTDTIEKKGNKTIIKTNWEC